MMKRRILALFTALALMVSLIPGTVLAQTEEGVQPSEPEATQTEPQPNQSQTEPLQEAPVPEQTREPTLPEEITSETPAEQPSTELPKPVTVSLTVILGDGFGAIQETEMLVADWELQVPWFDLACYGMSGGESSITLTHLLIYATETLACGLDGTVAGQGYLMENGLLGTSTLCLAAEPEAFWSWEGTLLCYREDQPVEDRMVPLEENDRITLTVMKEPVPAKPGTLTVSSDTLGQADTLTLTVDSGADVFYAPRDSYDTFRKEIRQWYYVGTATEDGQVTLPMADMLPGEYCFATAARQREEEILLPQARIVTVMEETPAAPSTLMGDVNDDGVVDGLDAVVLSGYINGIQTLEEDILILADLSGDGRINILDVALIYRQINIAPEEEPVQ